MFHIIKCYDLIWVRFMPPMTSETAVVCLLASYYLLAAALCCYLLFCLLLLLLLLHWQNLIVDIGEKTLLYMQVLANNKWLYVELLSLS